MNRPDDSDRALVESLFHRTADLPAGDRAEFLDAQCAGRLEVRAKVESLLRHYEAAADGFLGRPIHDLPRGVLEENRVPKQIGPYRILGRLGEGGMGVVYRAEQQNPRREVALKVIRPGLASRESLRRFELEATLLARLNHPGIAQIHEAGVHTDDSGTWPYFAMELVEGRPLSALAAPSASDTDGKLRLFTQICDAVQYAHQRGVIHRDLKPSNILVVDQLGGAIGRADAAGGTRGNQPSTASVKVLDFGVARAADVDGQTITLRTNIGEVLGTLAYMSPEQLTGDPCDVDTRTDVYSLGVILFELLTGSLPYDLRNCAVPDAARRIVDHDPRRLGTVDRRLRGEIETIVHRAVEKDRTRRYQSAGGLADDIRRHLAGEPIEAKRDSRAYVVRKFVRRHRAAVVGASLFMLLLLASSVALAVLYRRELGARERAQQETLAAQQAKAAESEARRTAETVLSFLSNDMLFAVSPEQLGQDVTMREVLQAAAASLASRFQDRPAVRGAIETALGDAFVAIGDLDRAEPVLTGAVDLLESRVGPESPEALRARHSLARLRDEQGRHTEAIAILEPVVAAEARVLGADHPDTHGSRLALASAYLAANQPARALPVFEGLLGIYGTAEAENHERTLSCLHGIARVYDDLGRPAEAEPLYRRAWEISSRTRGSDHLRTLVFASNLGQALTHLNKLEEADEVLTPASAAARERLGNDHTNTVVLLANLAILRETQQRFAEAAELFQRRYETVSRTVGAQHRMAIDARNDLAMLAIRQNQNEVATRIWEELLPLAQAEYGDEDPQTLRLRGNLARTYAEADRLAEAEPLQRSVLAVQARVLGDDHPSTMVSRAALASMLTTGGRYTDAEPLIVPAANFARANYPVGHRARNSILAAYGRCMAGLGRYEEAEPALLEVVGPVEVDLGPSHKRTQAIFRGLIVLYERTGQAEKADTWRQKLAAE